MTRTLTQIAPPRQSYSQLGESGRAASMCGRTFGITAVQLRRGLGLGVMLLAIGVAWATVGALITLAGLTVGVFSLWAATPLGSVIADRRILPTQQVEWLALPGAGLWALATGALIAAPSSQTGGRPPLLAGVGLIAASSWWPPAGPARTVAEDLLAVGSLVSSLWVARALRRPQLVRGQSLEIVRDRVHTILSEHGEDSLSPYVMRPDKEFKIAGDGLVAFTVVADTVVVSGDPVGPPEAAAEALAALARRARRAGLRMVAFGASDEHRDSFTALGMHAICAGEEAVVNPADFSLEGRSVRKLRQSANRLTRCGWELSLHEGREIGLVLEAEIGTVEARWRAAQPRVLGFAMSMGAFEAPIGPDDLFALARSPEGELRGVIRLLAHRGKLSLDVMRRVGETPNGLNEALICAVLERARETGVAEVSLNYAGLGHLLRGGGEGRLLRAALSRPPLAWLRRRFQLDRLVVFNEKFSPSWRPRYLMVDSRATLPLALWRVLQAEGHLRRPPTQTSTTTTVEAGLGSAHAAGDGLGR